MIFFTGDLHGEIDIKKLNSKNCPAKENDYVIICGDFGLIWNKPNQKGYKTDQYWLKWLENKPFTTLFVDGNHENFDILDNLPVETWRGGKVHKINSKVIHLMRGQIFTIEGKKIFTFGGAASHDKWTRVPNISWWKREMPSMLEYNEGLDNLIENDWRVDYVVTHCAPSHIQNQICSWYERDELNSFLQVISKKLKFKAWYFGHYHKNDTFIQEKENKLYQVLYNKIVTSY